MKDETTTNHDDATIYQQEGGRDNHDDTTIYRITMRDPQHGILQKEKFRPINCRVNTVMSWKEATFMMNSHMESPRYGTTV